MDSKPSMRPYHQENVPDDHADGRSSRSPFEPPFGYKSRIQNNVQYCTSPNAHGGIAFEEIVERGYVVIGSPDEVAKQLRRVAVDMNVGQMMLLMQFGDMSKQVAMHNTELFAKRVMPQVQSLFDDEWENHWWPKPLPASERARPAEALPR